MQWQVSFGETYMGRGEGRIKTGREWSDVATSQGMLGPPEAARGEERAQVKSVQHKKKKKCSTFSQTEHIHATSTHIEK